MWEYSFPYFQCLFQCYLFVHWYNKIGIKYINKWNKLGGLKTFISSDCLTKMSGWQVLYSQADQNHEMK